MDLIPMENNELYKVLLTFDNDSVYETFSITTDSNPERFIDTVSLREQNSIDSGNPLGIVSPNSLSLRLVDATNILNPANPSSPYFGYMRNGVKVELFISSDQGEVWDKAGVYYTNSWSIGLTEAGITPVDLSCQDNLAYIGNVDIPELDAYGGVNVVTLLERVFQKIGLTEQDYFIDPSLPTINMIYSVAPGEKVRDLLNSITHTLNAKANTNREGVITITPAFPTLEIYGELDVSDSETINFQHNQISAFNKVQLSYNKVDDRPSDNLLSLQNQVLKNGLNEFINLKLDSTILGVDGVFLSFPTDTTDAISYIKSVNYKASQSGITISIDTELPTNIYVNIDVEGRAVGQTTAIAVSEVKARDPKVANVLQLTNPIIQDEVTANAHVNIISDYLYKMERELVVSGFFSPYLTVGLYITIATGDPLLDGNYLITGVDLTVSEFYNCILTLIKLREG